MGHLGIQHDRGNARQMIDARLRHRRARVGAEHERGVVVPADDQIDRRELSGIEARIARGSD